MNLIIPLAILLLLRRKSGRSARWSSPLLRTKVTSRFGTRVNPVTKEKEEHNGVDLVAPSGSPVYAPRSGEVYKELTNDVGGLQLILLHPGGWKTGYAHLSKVLVKPGQKIARGELVAMSGQSGRVTGPHLHFTLSNPSGDRVDPEKYFTFQ